MENDINRSKEYRDNEPKVCKMNIDNLSKGYKVNSNNVPSVPKENISPPELKVSSVLFVEQSKGGSLAESVRGTVRRLSPMLGFTLKVVENAGSKRGSILNNKDPWNGQMCGRLKCPPCSQDEEEKEDCKATNILYETLCKDCNPGKKDSRNSSLYDDRAAASIYVGKTSRSLWQRGRRMRF